MGQAAERAINTVIDMASDILMQDWMICHKDTLSINFGQRKLNMLYGSKVRFLIDSMIYQPLGKFEPSMFLETRFQKSGVKIFKMAPMSQRRINKVSGKGYSRQVGLMNLRSPQFNIVGVALALA